MTCWPARGGTSLLILLLACVLGPGLCQVPQEEKAALLRLRRDLPGSVGYKSTLLRNWDSTTDPCTARWKGGHWPAASDWR